ncbi:MAG: phosphoribosylglycinamide formyltransferase [Dehalococcoidia bacterium]
MLKVGWFSTARGESSRKLLSAAFESIRSGELKAKIDFVFCSREPGESEKTDLFIEQVKGYGIPLICLSVKEFALRSSQQIGVKTGRLPEWRLEYDRQVMKKLGDYNPDICVLAGYMLIVGPEMCRRYNMINLHPALPKGPKGTWQEVIWDLISARATESGVMMHLVTPDLDRGPVISYCRYTITGLEFDNLWESVDNVPVTTIKAEQGVDNELFKKVRQAGFMRETPLIIHTLKSFSEGKITIDRQKRLLDAQGRPISGYDLTAQIDRALAEAKKRGDQ